MSSSSTRREAAFILTQWKTQGIFPNRLLVDNDERGFVMDLLYTTLRHANSCEWFLKQSVKQMPSGDLWALLMIGCAQLYYMQDVPNHAAVFETVNAAKTISPAAARFVNAVLQTLIRNHDALFDQLKTKPLNLRMGYPAALINGWLSRWDETKTAAICEAGNQPAQTVLRPLKVGLIPENTTPHPIDPMRSFILKRGISPSAHPSIIDGSCVIQDPATQGAIDLLDLADPSIMRIWDVCAAPGGKTAQIVAQLPAATQPFILASDRHQDRLDTLKDTLTRCHMADRVSTMQLDAMDLTQASDKASLEQPFDRILVDAPCSNSGVLGRRADARWRWSNKRLSQRIADQRAILDAVAPLLAKGGKLVYSTCSIEQTENELQVKTFLDRHPDFSFVASIFHTPDQGCDGAFAACLTRN